MFTHCIPSKLEKEEDGENIFAEQIIVEEDREKRKLLFVQKGKPNKKKQSIYKKTNLEFYTVDQKSELWTTLGQFSAL